MEHDYLSPDYSPADLQEMSVLGLAHIGDAVYGLMARTWLLTQGSLTAAGMHKKTIGLVCALAQSKAADRIWESLSEQERAVFMRGRNAQIKMVPKNQSREDYQRATALEALFGYLYATGQRERLNLLFASAMGA